MAGGGGGGDTLPSRAPQFATFLPRRSGSENSEFDITAMIDLVFMMNIFFLVTSLTKSAAEVDLPQAKHCSPADEKDCVVILVRSGTDPASPVVSVTDGETEQQIAQTELEERIRTAVEGGVEQNKNKVLIKAEAKVLLGHIVRISTLATAVEGVEPLFAVMEVDQGGESP
jgi:biopolymer transport protein ExbD